MTTGSRQNAFEQSCGLECSHVIDLWCNSLDPVFDSDSLFESYQAHMEEIENGRSASRLSREETATSSNCSRQRQLPLGQAFAIATNEFAIDTEVEKHLSRHGTLCFKTYGYKHGYVGLRSTTISHEHLPNWRNRLKTLWNDLFDAPPFLIFTIRPPPTTERNTVSVIVQMDTVPQGEALVLMQLVYANIRPAEPTVISVPYFTSRSTIFDILHIPPSSQRTAILRQGFITWLTGFPRHVHDGDFLRVLLDEPAMEVADDAISLSQNVLVPKGMDTWRTLPELPEEYQALRRERLEENAQDEEVFGEGRFVLHDPQGWMRFATAVHHNGIEQVTVIFHGLLFRTLGSRRVQLPGLHPSLIAPAINNVWPEFIGLDRRAFLVRPQPRLSFPDHEAVSIVVEFLDHLHEPDESIVPVLQECFRHGHAETERVAAYSSQVFSRTQAQIDFENCPSDIESTRIDFWVRDLPVLPGSNRLVEPGDLISIRIVDVIGTFGTFSQSFPDGFEFANSMSELSALHPKQPATWTFVGATAQGTPALLDYFQPPWEGTHDPHRVQNFFHNLLVTRGLQIDDYILHYVPSPLLTDATFIYGKRGQEGCLTHVVWSAQWNETWREQYCHYIPRMSTAQSVLERSGLRGYECSFLLDGRRVEANGILSLYPGAQLEIELDLNASSTGDTSSQQEDVDGPDEATLWQVSQALYRQGQSPKIQGLPLTCRPNADITLDFDDFIPLPEGGRIIPPPNWNAHPLLRFAADNDAVYRNRQGFLTVDCRTWLLPHGRQGHQQPRDIQIRAQLMLHLAERIRHLWRDIVAPGDALRIQHVRPTPLARGRQRQSPKLHLLVEVNRPLEDLSRPTLLSFQQISAQGLSDDVVWMPWLAADVVTLRSIHQASMLGCEPHNLLVALADRARGWMGSHQQRHVAPGAYIPVWWDLRWNADPEPVPRPNALETPVDPDDQEDESLLQRPQHALIQVASPSAVSSLVGDSCLEKVPLVEIADNPMQEEEIEAGMEAEALSLMQRAVSRSPRRTTPLSTSSHEDDNRLPVHTFRMSSSYKKVVLFRSQEMTYIPQLTRLWQLTPHNPLLAVHQVWHGPADLESGAKATLLLELAADRNRQAISDDQMVLVDIALESSSDSTVIRRVLWTRRFMTRPSFLHLLSVQEFCNSPATDCHVEKNKITWHKQDTFSREFTSGDYVRLLVRGPNTMTPAEVQVVLCEQEGADAQRYLYTRSPSHSPGPSAPSNEGGESEFEVFHDSPVENHTPIHERPSRNLKDWMAGSSKNQNHNRQGRGKENVAPAVNPQGHHLAHPYPCLQPHVSDRWCAWQVRKDDSTVAPEESGVIDVDPPSEPNRAMKSTVLCLDDLVPMPDSIQTVPCKAEGLRQMIDQLMCPGFPLEKKIHLLSFLSKIFSTSYPMTSKRTRRLIHHLQFGSTQMGRNSGMSKEQKRYQRGLLLWLRNGPMVVKRLWELNLLQSLQTQLTQPGQVLAYVTRISLKLKRLFGLCFGWVRNHWCKPGVNVTL